MKQRHTQKRYEILAIDIDSVCKHGFYFAVNFEHQYNFCVWMDDSKISINMLFELIKNLDNKVLPLSFEFKDDYKALKLHFSQSNNEDMIYIDVIDLESGDIEFLIELSLKIFVRKIKAAIYYTIKYNFEFLDSEKECFRDKILSLELLNTLKTTNNGVSTIKLTKNKKLNLNIIVDGKNIDCLRYVDSDELIKTLSHSGKYYIYTCTCGNPECGGIYHPVAVEHNESYIYWTMINPYGGMFKFNKEQYVNEVTEKINCISA